MAREDENFAVRREFSRVDAHVPFEIRVVPAEERQSVRARTSGGTTFAETRALPELQDKILAEWVKAMNSKLDAIVNMLSFQREGFGSMPFAHVNISGGGLGFVSKDKYNLGETIEMKIILPSMPPVALFLYGEVVKSDRLTNSYMTATKFVAMDEEVQDEIVKFVFRRQREILREKRR